MKITELNGFILGFPLAQPMGNALNIFKKREIFVLQIVTDSGVYGWGESGNSPYASSAFVQNRLAGIVLGQSPLLYTRHYHAMNAALGYDRRGAAMMALSAVDIALHDITARSFGISVATLLGGPVRETLFTYASGPFLRAGSDPYVEYERDVEKYLALNFGAIKPRAGFTPDADGRMAEGLRRAVGKDVAIMVDMNQSYTAASAIRSAQNMEGANLLWIEEPVQPEDIGGYRSVSRNIRTAVAGGEALGSLSAFRDFLQDDIVSIAQPDMSICGGYSGFKQIAALAHAHHMPTMPHVFGTTINFHASLQMASVIEAKRGGGAETYPYIEYDMMENPLLSLGNSLGPDKKSMLTVPTGPGTGLSLRPEQLEPWIVSSWSERL